MKSYFSLTTPDYMPGAICLINSLKKHSEIPITIMGLDLNSDEKSLLERLGASVVEVPKITSKLAKVFSFHKNEDFCQNCFCKLNMWNMTEYDKIVYLDSDITVLKNIDCMFETNSDFSACSSLVVSIDISGFREHPSFKEGARISEIPKQFLKASYNDDHFNAGVLVLKPSKEKYKKMMSLKDAIGKGGHGDQGFLNEYFKGRWNKLDYKFNYSRRHYEMWPEDFEEDIKDISVLHFTGADDNPWDKKPENQIERIWWSNFDPEKYDE